MQNLLLPTILNETLIENGIILTISVPKDLAYFNGHFDQIPIVAGVVQIHWAVHYAKQYLGLMAEFKDMENIKFKELILAEQPIKLELHYTENTQKLVFSYYSDSVEYSSGRIYFHAL